MALTCYKCQGPDPTETACFCPSGYSLENCIITSPTQCGFHTDLPLGSDGRDTTGSLRLCEVRPSWAFLLASQTYPVLPLLQIPATGVQNAVTTPTHPSVLEERLKEGGEGGLPAQDELANGPSPRTPAVVPSRSPGEGHEALHFSNVCFIFGATRNVQKAPSRTLRAFRAHPPGFGPLTAPMAAF